MKILIDTHILLWALDTNIGKLTEKETSAIEDINSIIYVSVATLWELAIKVSTGKIQLPNDIFTDWLETLGFEILPIKLNHLLHYTQLPLIHKDPFDRLLVAQSNSEQIQLMSRDEKIASYEVNLF